MNAKLFLLCAFLTLPVWAQDIVTRIPEAQRQQIFTDSVMAERKAAQQAEMKYPIKPRITKDFIYAHTDEKNRLEEKYEQEVMIKYGISKDEMNKIGVEGLMKKWPLPPR